MTANLAAQPSFSPDHRGTSRVGRTRNAGPQIIPIRRGDTNGVPKVALESLSLSYNANDGSKLLAWIIFSWKSKPESSCAL